MIRLVDVERFYQAGPTRTYVLRRINLEIREASSSPSWARRGRGRAPAQHSRPARLRLGAANTGCWASLSMPPKKRVELNKRHIGFVFQKYQLIDDLTVYENLEIPAVLPRREAQGGAPRSWPRRWTGSRWWGRRISSPATLSGGQQQRGGRGTAVIAGPKLLLADEPTGTCTAPRARRSWSCSPGSTARNHDSPDPLGAQRLYGHRTIHLHDGWIAEPSPAEAAGQRSPSG